MTVETKTAATIYQTRLFQSLLRALQSRFSLLSRFEYFAKALAPAHGSDFIAWSPSVTATTLASDGPQLAGRTALEKYATAVAGWGPTIVLM
mmetsp:Transcript_12185/g.35266  ORF Transcript_12185/g.35266 Transcript_12185/m.35266 type:complete len:92 (+) Transcript_12185:732-1007(+)